MKSSGFLTRFQQRVEAALVWARNRETPAAYSAGSLWLLDYKGKNVRELNAHFPYLGLFLPSPCCWQAAAPNDFGQLCWRGLRGPASLKISLLELNQ